MKLKKGDKVVVIAGKHKGETSSIARVISKKSLVLLEGINVAKRHRRANQPGKGQIIDKPMPMHISNVMIADPRDGKPTRIKITRDKKGLRERVAVKSGQTLK
jgi:large subunit ribosomal protein L24